MTDSPAMPAGAEPARHTPDDPPSWSTRWRVALLLGGILFFLSGISSGYLVTQAEDERAQERAELAAQVAVGRSQELQIATAQRMVSAPSVASLRQQLARDGIAVSADQAQAALVAACQDQLAALALPDPRLRAELRAACTPRD